ncbi:hypothetical protein LCGC14_1953110 [marine sediment metagenome]|uniref:Uncharacterized protein n=1 Tax=marine sediment metagenome TaxID=412755 RepID=A0A0F9FGR9_9ZZZZ
MKKKKSKIFVPVKGKTYDLNPKHPLGAFKGKFKIVDVGALQGTDRVIFKTNTSGASWWFADDYDWKLIELKKIECPECDKIVAVQEKSQEIGDFIEWLGNKKDLHLCFWENQYNYRMNTTIEKLLAEYFEIDLEKVENEKQAILDELRKKP